MKAAATPDVSVVLPTYNRARLLEPAIASLLTQRANGVAHEIVVVDNASQDETPAVVRRIAQRAPVPVRYVAETRRGVAYARNSGVDAARAPIVAFLDDDECAEPGWIATIKQLLDAHPEIDFVAGKVLPRWECAPPAWITDRHWGALGLIDRGDRTFRVDRERHGFLGSGNLAVRRAAFLQAGGFDPGFQRLEGGIGSTEDHEFLARLRRAGRVGLYAPELVATATVPVERLARDYHRRWHTGNGAYCARMRLLAPPEGCATVFGLPTWEYRATLGHAARWVLCRLRGDDAGAFDRELRLRWALSYVRTSRTLAGTPPAAVQILNAVRGVIRNRVRSFSERHARGGH